MARVELGNYCVVIFVTQFSANSLYIYYCNFELYFIYKNYLTLFNYFHYNLHQTKQAYVFIEFLVRAADGYVHPIIFLLSTIEGYIRPSFFTIKPIKYYLR